MKKFLNDRKAAAVFVMPAFIVFILFVALPFAVSVVLSLSGHDTAGGIRPAGFDNYIRMAGDAGFRRALKNTAIFVSVTASVQTVCGLAGACLIQGLGRGKYIFKSVFILPAVLPPFAAGALWMLLCSPVLGVNQLLAVVGIHGPIWSEHPVGLAAVAYIWQYAGLSMLLFSLSLSSVDRSVREAAYIEGCSRCAVFRHIIIPAVKHTVAAVLLLNILASLRAFDQIWIMTGGETDGTSGLLTGYLYKYNLAEYRSADAGMGSASVALAAACLIIAYILYKNVLTAASHREFDTDAGKPSKNTASPPVYIALTVLAAVYLLPVAWAVLSSLRTNAGLYLESFGLSPEDGISNYITAWAGGGLQSASLYSLMIGTVTAALSLVLGSMAAFAIARLRGALAGAVRLCFVCGIVLPVYCILPVLVKLYESTGLGKTVWGLVPLYLALSVPFTVLIMTALYRSIPDELTEAAYMDGSSVYGIFRHIYLPVSKPGLLTAAFIILVSVWNGFSSGLVLLSEESESGKIFAVASAGMLRPDSMDIVQMLATTVIAFFPAIALFCAMGDKIVRYLEMSINNISKHIK